MYITVLAIQIIVYQAVGAAVTAACRRLFRTEARPLPGLRQLLGIMTVSAVQAIVTLCRLPRTLPFVLTPAAFIAVLALLWSRPSLGRPAWRAHRLRDGLVSRRFSLADAAWAALAATVGLYWLALGLVNGANLVPAGDGLSWVNLSLCWVRQEPFRLVGRPPLTNLVEALNFLLLGAEDLNCALLATWWLHVLAVTVCGTLAARLWNRWLAVLLVVTISASTELARNVQLGYRDALVAKYAAAALLAALYHLRQPEDRQRALMLGALFAAGALIKHEGVFFGGFTLGLAFLWHCRRLTRKSVAVALKFLTPAFAVALAVAGAWWATHVLLSRTGNAAILWGFNRVPTGGLLHNLRSVERLYKVTGSMTPYLKEPVYCLAAVALAIGVARRETRLACGFSALCLLLSLGFVFSSYMLTFLDLEYHINTSLWRLMFTPSALAFILVCAAAHVPPRAPTETDLST